MAEKDYMGALQKFLAADTGIARIYVGGLPEGVITKENPAPAAAIIATPGGGRYGSRDRLPIVHQAFDVVCYGETRKEANDLHRAIAESLRLMERNSQTVNSIPIILYDAVKAGGLISLVDSETLLPIEVQTYEIIAEI